MWQPRLWVRVASTLLSVFSLMVPLLRVSLLASMERPSVSWSFSTTSWVNTSDTWCRCRWSSRPGWGVPPILSSSCGVPVTATAALKVTVTDMVSPMA